MRPTPVWFATLKTLAAQRAVLDEIGVDKFRKLAFELQFRSKYLKLKKLPLQGDLQKCLQEIAKLPKADQDAAKALLLTRRVLGRHIMPVNNTSRRQFHMILDWIGLERFLALAPTANFDWDRLPAFTDLKPTVLPGARFDVIRKSDLPPEDKYLAMTTWMKGTEFGQFVLTTRGFPPHPPNYKETLMNYVGLERFIELVAKPPLFDLNEIKGCTTKFPHMLARIQLADLNPKDEERALVSLLSTTQVGKRLILAEGLPLPKVFSYEHNKAIKSYRPLQSLYRDPKVANIPEEIQACVDRIGRERFHHMIMEEQYDLSSIKGFDAVKTTKARLRLVQESTLPEADKLRAFSAVLCRSAWAELLVGNNRDLKTRIWYIQSGSSSITKSLHGFQRRLNYLGPARFVELSKEPPVDLSKAFPDVEAGDWTAFWTRVYHSDLEGEERERWFASVLRGSSHGRKYLEEVRRIATKKGDPENLQPLSNPPTTTVWRPRVQRVKAHTPAGDASSSSKPSVPQAIPA